MANDRVYLKNSVTGETLLLAKYWHGKGWQSHLTDEKVNEFLSNFSSDKALPNEEIQIEYE